MLSYMAKPAEINRKWYLVDASNKPLGRLASEIAKLLRGKHKPTFTPHVDVGDYVVVINAEKVALTGRKRQQKKYYYHTGYPGGIRSVGYDEMLDRKPEQAVFLAVKGMLPKNRLGRQMLKKLKVYRYAKHIHEAQKPEILEIGV